MMRSLITMLAAFALALPALGTQHRTAALTEGEVRKVDKSAKKITIKHEAIRNLEMPAMTMVFQVKDPALLERFQAGDKVKFEAEKEGSAFVLKQIEKAQ